MFLGWSSLKFVRRFDSIKNSGCHGNQMELLKEFFLKSSSETAGPILKQFHRIVPYVTLFKSCLRNFDPSKTWPPRGGAFFTVWTSEKFFKTLLLWNRQSGFEIISQDCSLGDPFRNFFAKFWYAKKHGRNWGGGDFLHYTDMKKFLKNLLFWNPRSDLEIISQECSWGDPFKKLFVKKLFVITVLSLIKAPPLINAPGVFLVSNHTTIYWKIKSYLKIFALSPL